MPVFCFLRGLTGPEELPVLVATVCDARSGASLTTSADSSDFRLVPRGGAIVIINWTFDTILRKREGAELQCENGLD